jgi:hypothetical protein
MVCFSAILSAQTENAFKYEVKARGGVTVGMNGTYAGSVFTVNPNSKIHLVDSITYNSIIAPTDYRVYHGSDTLIPYIPVAGQTAGIALADSTGSLEGNYMTRLQVSTLHINNDVEIMRTMGSAIISMPIGMVLSDISSSVTIVESSCNYVATYIREATTITGIMFAIETAGVYIPADYDGVALYSTTPGVTTDTLKLVASSTDDNADPNIWEGSITDVTKKAFSAPYLAAPGLYYIALVYNESDAGGETAPKLRASATGGAIINKLDFAKSRFIFGTKSATTSLPASILASDITVGTGKPFVGTY